MPVYNGEKYLRESIDSILSQTFSDFEFIIINDASTDSTEEIINSYNDDRIVYLKNEQNLGVAGTLNRGLDVAKGEYVARMDADDIAMPKRFEEQVLYMDAHEDVGVCGSNLIIFSDSAEDKAYIYSENDNKIRIDMIFNPAFAHPSVMLRSEIINTHNIRYDISFEKAEDYKMWYDILSKSKGHNVQNPLLRYRHHQSQVTKTNKTEMHIAVSKMRKLMYATLCLNTDKYLELYTRICNGERTFSEAEYSSARELFALILSSPCDYDKKSLKKTLSFINYAIYKNCQHKNYKPLSLWEYLYVIKGKLR